MYSVTKEIRFCYGHRLMRHAGKCRHLHGHSARAAITVRAERLDAEGMVCDFSDIAAAVREFIDQELDHNLLLHREDPLVPLLREAGERFKLLDGHPTAEFLARLILEHARERGLPAVAVTLWETDSASATVRFAGTLAGEVGARG